MPKYQITDNLTGKTYEINGPRPPTQDEVKQLIVEATPKLPEASIPERFMANALFSGDENARKAYLMQRGKSPEEPGKFTSPRETLADIVESAGPAAKLAGQVGGELFGTPGGIPGFVAGGAAGRGGVQAGIEGIAGMAGMGVPGAGGRVAKEAAIGAITSLGGKVLSRGVPKAISFINNKFPLVKKTEEYMLTNITKMAKPMQDWVKGRWTEVYNTARTQGKPAAVLASRVRNSVVPLIKKLKSTFGVDVTEAKQIKNIRPNLVGLDRELAADVFPSYADITRGEKASILRLVRSLAKPQRAGSLPKIMDRLSLMQRKLTSPLNAQSPGDLKTISEMTSFMGAVRKRLIDRVKLANPNLDAALTKYSNFMDTYDLFDTYIGSNEQQVFEYIKTHLFNPEDIYGQDALNKMFSPQYLGGGLLVDLKDLSAANFMRSGLAAASGYKAFIPTAVGGLVGGGIGQVVGGSEGRTTGAKIGSGIGGALTLPYVTPAWASGMYRGLEATVPKIAGVSSFLATHLPKRLAAPLGEALNELSGSFSINATAEDINKLRSSKIK